MKWTLHPALSAFESHQALWDELNHRTSNSVLLDAKFVGPLLRYFGGEGVRLAVCDDATRPGMALIERGRFGTWRTFQPSQAPLGLILLGRIENAEASMENLVRSLPGFALEFSALQQDPFTSPFHAVAESGSVARQAYIDTARVTVNGTFEDYWKGRGRHIVDNVAQRLRRLARDGTQLELRTVREPGAMEEAIREYGRLESTGWKGKAGTAVEGDNPQGLFYRDVLTAFCKEGRGAVYQLRFDGVTVASKLTIERDGTVVFLKTAYDEAYRNHAPGYLLQYELLRRLHDEGAIRSVEFYGRVRTGWTDRWTSEVRSMFHVTFYRHPWVRSAVKLLRRFRGQSLPSSHETDPEARPAPPQASAASNGGTPFPGTRVEDSREPYPRRLHE